jgi:hypothetical protein
MALSTDKVREYMMTGPDDRNSLPVKASTTIPEGAAVSIASGLARNFNVSDTTDGFGGFAVKRADNGTGSDSDIRVEVKTRGYVKLSVAGVSGVGNVTDAVYASDNDTFTTASTSNVQIGKVDQWIVGAWCWVYFEALAVRSI